jgi:nucleolar protein 9
LNDKVVHFFFLIKILCYCQVVVANAVDLMSSCHGSHVLRSLLCLCKGATIDSSEFHVTKSSTVLAERLNFKASRMEEDYSPHQLGFPDLLKFLVSGMIKFTRKDFKTMQVDQFSSLVLQACFQLIVFIINFFL